MILNYIFLNYHFNNYAHQSELLKAVSHTLRQGKVRSLNNQFINASDLIVENMGAYLRSTKSFFGWVKSFVPGTSQFNYRSTLANQFETTNTLYLKLSLSLIKSSNTPSSTLIESDDSQAMKSKKNDFIKEWKCNQKKSALVKYPANDFSTLSFLKRR